MRRWTLVIFVLGVLLFGWTLIADRLTPYTADASVRSYVIRVATQPGYRTSTPTQGSFSTVLKSGQIRGGIVFGQSLANV